jgi:hypothetical protein
VSEPLLLPSVSVCVLPSSSAGPQAPFAAKPSAFIHPSQIQRRLSNLRHCTAPTNFRNNAPFLPQLLWAS